MYMGSIWKKNADSWALLLMLLLAKSRVGPGNLYMLSNCHLGSTDLHAFSSISTQMSFPQKGLFLLSLTKSSPHPNYFASHYPFLFPYSTCHSWIWSPLLINCVPSKTISSRTAGPCLWTSLYPTHRYFCHTTAQYIFVE